MEIEHYLNFIEIKDIATTNKIYHQAMKIETH